MVDVDEWQHTLHDFCVDTGFRFTPDHCGGGRDFSLYGQPVERYLLPSIIGQAAGQSGGDESDADARAVEIGLDSLEPFTGLSGIVREPSQHRLECSGADEIFGIDREFCKEPDRVSSWKTANRPSSTGADVEDGVVGQSLGSFGFKPAEHLGNHLDGADALLGDAFSIHCRFDKMSGSDDFSLRLPLSA